MNHVRSITIARPCPKPIHKLTTAYRPCDFCSCLAAVRANRAEIYAARSMVLDAARKRDEGKDISTESSCCKPFASEMCGRVADRAVQIHGGAGYISEYSIERFYRDVRFFRIYEGTSQIQQLIIAKNMINSVTETM